MRTIGVVTVARSDYGIYVPLLRKIVRDRTLRLHLMVSGSHLWREQGMTVRQIERDGFKIGARIPTKYQSDTPAGIARALGDGVAGFARAFESRRPDILIVLGDRFDMISAALAALPFRIPVAHLHGGELSLGAFDDSLRHSMTKLSHLHFASTRDYASRIAQLGEESWRIVVAGALGLDNLRDLEPLGPAEISRRWGLDVTAPFLLVTFHPETLDSESPETQVARVLKAIAGSRLRGIFTLPNADTGASGITRRIRKYVASTRGAQFVESLGTQGYFSLMKRATAMVGNSSSGIIEAPSFGLPVVNIGGRQDGRTRARNVIDVPCDATAIRKAIAKAASPAFRASLRGLKNPYDSGRAADIILKTIRKIRLDDRLLRKKFVDHP